jgi:AcrR family transcriptional regulator
VPAATTSPAATPSARETELLELAYSYVLERGISELSLRPLASAIGSSPRVLLFLFGSKDELVRRLLARARQDELEGPVDAHRVWAWLSDPAHAGLLRLWTEAYARSLVDPTGPWGDFARSTVEDWLALLASGQPAAVRRTAAGRAQRTAVLAVLRGAMLDLLATADQRRVGRAVTSAIASLETSWSSAR